MATEPIKSSILSKLQIGTMIVKGFYSLNLWMSLAHFLKLFKVLIFSFRENFFVLREFILKIAGPVELSFKGKPIELFERY